MIRRLAPVYDGQITNQDEVDAIVLAVTADHDARLAHWLDGPPQTNEAARSASFHARAKMAKLWQSYSPRFEINELGASAGINTMMERYHYDLGGIEIRPAELWMQIAPEWRGAPPPSRPVEIVAIRGCDRAPGDLTDPEEALRLKSYVWPEMTERLVRMDAAVAFANQKKPSLVRTDAADWVVERLASPQEAESSASSSTRLSGNIFPNPSGRLFAARCSRTEKAAVEKPLAWISLETNRENFRHELQVTYWPGGEATRLLAQAHAHAAWIESYL